MSSKLLVQLHWYCHCGRSGVVDNVPDDGTKIDVMHEHHSRMLFASGWHPECRGVTSIEKIIPMSEIDLAKPIKPGTGATPKAPIPAEAADGTRSLRCLVRKPNPPKSPDQKKMKKEQPTRRNRDRKGKNMKSINEITITLPKNAATAEVFTVSVDMAGITADSIGWDAGELEAAVAKLCAEAGIETAAIDVGWDNRGPTFATVTVYRG